MKALVHEEGAAWARLGRKREGSAQKTAWEQIKGHKGRCGTKRLLESSWANWAPKKRDITECTSREVSACNRRKGKNFSSGKNSSRGKRGEEGIKEQEKETCH